jgi:hypothetical protein
VRFKWDSTKVEAETRLRGQLGVRALGEFILQRSTTRVPLEEAILQDSGAVDVDPVEAHGTVSYDTKYAVKQHEDPTLKHDEGRSAFYLKIAMDEGSAVAETILAKAMKGAF